LRDDKSKIPQPNKWDLLGGCIEFIEREIKEGTNIIVYNIKLILERDVIHLVQSE